MSWVMRQKHRKSWRWRATALSLSLTYVHFSLLLTLTPSTRAKQVTNGISLLAWLCKLMVGWYFLALPLVVLIVSLPRRSQGQAGPNNNKKQWKEEHTSFPRMTLAHIARTLVICFKKGDEKEVEGTSLAQLQCPPRNVRGSWLVVLHLIWLNIEIAFLLFMSILMTSPSIIALLSPFEVQGASPSFACHRQNKRYFSNALNVLDVGLNFFSASSLAKQGASMEFTSCLSYYFRPFFWLYYC